ncbi:MAG: hypothetical protein KIT84_22580 [Labilithrix sp.]|nr:hypothetical protein [Labilithrix sp.]MCW5813831.1 hypothetical protein [Labilithrix sp.]
MGTDEKRQTLVFGGQGAPVLGAIAGGPRLAVPPPPPTFGGPRLAVRPPAPTLDEVDAAWDTQLASMLPPVVEVLSSDDLIPDDDDRPSDRVTVPNQLAPKLVEELSASDLEADESDRSLKTTRPPPPTQRPTLQELASSTVRTMPPPFVEPIVRRRDTVPVPLASVIVTEPTEQTTPASAPPVSFDARPPMTSLPGDTARSVPVPRLARANVLLFAASHVAVAASVLLYVWATREPPRPTPRHARVAITERTAVGTPASGSVPLAAPTEGCRVEDLARIVAPRAMLGPGLDASVLESGFGIGLASAPHEATGIRLDASTLRTAETLRVQSIWPVGRVTIDRGSDPEEERMQVRLDASDARTVTPSLRITAQKGGVFATDESQPKRLLWGIPGAVPKTPETVRALTRPDGATIVAVRRPGLYWVGVTGHGPLTPVVRSTRTLGAPALASMPEGGVMAWAERGSDGFTIMTAAIATEGARATVSEPEALADGMSPALANLPSGELLLAYSDGGAGAHRVVAQRLGPDLTPRGGLLVLSEAGTNAGSPALAVDPDGRAVVAYLTFAKGQAEVRATALTCH